MMSSMPLIRRRPFPYNLRLKVAVSVPRNFQVQFAILAQDLLYGVAVARVTRAVTSRIMGLVA